MGVPPNNEFITLFAWMHSQHSQYQYNRGTLRGKRVAQLDNIGFVWRVRKAKEEEEEGEGKKEATKNSSGVSKDDELLTRDERWEKRYQELIKFRDEAGHFIVPSNDKFNTLNFWVKYQRSKYHSNSGGTLWGKRVAQLERIGFPWRRQKENKKEEKEEGKEKATKNDERWEKRYQELIKFRDEAGHFIVPSNDKFNTL